MQIMNDENVKQDSNGGEMKKRREKMADGKRYLIYYTFEVKVESEKEQTSEVKSDE